MSRLIEQVDVAIDLLLDRRGHCLHLGDFLLVLFHLS